MCSLLGLLAVTLCLVESYTAALVAFIATGVLYALT